MPDWRGHVLVCGATGMGKTTLAVAQWLADHGPWWVALDVKGDISANLTRRRQPFRLARRPSELLEAAKAGSRHVCYVGALDAASWHSFGEALHRIAAARPGVSLLADEMSIGFPNMVLPSDKRGFQRLVLQGRAPASVRIFGVAQRPASVNTDFRGNVVSVAAFKLPRKQDREAVGYLLGDRALPLLADLSPHQFLLGGTDGTFRTFALDESGGASPL